MPSKINILDLLSDNAKKELPEETRIKLSLETTSEPITETEVEKEEPTE
jgi:hypothetical protein